MNITCENEIEIFNRFKKDSILSEPVDVMEPEYVHRVLFYFQEYHDFVNYMVSKDHIHQILMSQHERDNFYSQINPLKRLFENNISELERFEGVNFSLTGQVVLVNLGLVDLFNRVIEVRL